MERDFLDDQLRRKLENYREEPPGDGWSRIEAGLSGVRPRRDVRWIRYAVAASLLAGALTTGVYLANRDRTPSLAVLRSVTEPIAFTPVVSEREIPVAQEIRAAAAFRPKISGGMPAAAVEAVSESGRESAQAAAQDIVPETQSVRAEPAGDDSGAGERPAAEQRSGTSQSTRPAWYGEAGRNEPAKRSRKTGRGVSVSLYAANAASGNQQSATPPNVQYMMSASDMSPMKKGSAGVFSARATQQDQIWEHRTPVTFGVSVGFRIAPNTALETGLTFTRLRSTTEIQAFSSYVVEQRLDYVGVPISATYTFLDSRYVTFYGRAGGTIEYCVSGRRVTSAKSASVSDLRTVEKIDMKGLQTSVGAGAGGMFNLTPHMGIYIEPGVSYYFEREDQPESYRTAHPLTFDLRAGLRFRFR